MNDKSELTTNDQIAGLARGDITILEKAVNLRERNLEASGLDARTFALTKIAALIALDAPPASYAWQIGMALEAGVTPDDLIGVVVAVAPQVGGPRVVAAAAEIAFVLGIAVEPTTEPQAGSD